MRWPLGVVFAIVLAAPASAGGPRARGGRPVVSMGPAREQAGAGVPQAGARMSPLRRANSLLRQGYYRMAAAAFAEAVAAAPTSAEAHVGLGVAWARLGTCSTALDEFRDWTHSVAFGAKVGLLAAHCAERQSYTEDAVAFTLLAWEKRPDNRTTLMRLVLDADRIGDSVLSGVALEYLWYVNPDQDESLFAEAALALRQGDITSFDAIDSMWRREGRSSDEMNRMRARSWLDVGDSAAAYEELRKGGAKIRRGADSRVMMAETTRRLGQTLDAEHALDGKLQGKLSGADSDAVLARLRVDAGRLEEAEALLLPYANEADEEIEASRWYVARAKGDTAAMAIAAAGYEANRLSPLRTLEHYIPVTQVR